MNPTEKYSSVYVAGYLFLYGADDGSELHIDREDIRAAIPTPAPLPINIDHIRNCTVGAVLALTDDEHGLFFLGKINCPVMIRTLETAASQEIFSEFDNLKTEERVLYLITNYLPSVSLSSKRLEPGEKADKSFLAHVALCLLGKRIGTIVTYDLTPENAIEPFRKLSPTTKTALLSEGQETERLLGDKVWHPSKEAMSTALLGTALNNMLLRDRWRTISSRRRMAGISGQKYLQASAWTALAESMTSNNASTIHPIGETANSDGIQKDDRIEVCATSPQTNKTLESRAFSGGSGFAGTHAISPPPQMSAQSPTEMSMNTKSHFPPGDDFIWVPMKSYNELVSRQATHAINAPEAAVGSQAPYSSSPLMIPAHLGQHAHIGGYGHASNPQFASGAINYMGGFPYALPIHPVPTGQSSLETKLSALLDCMTREKKSVDGDRGRDDMFSGQEERGRRGRKRPYNCDKSPEQEPYYPGEFQQSEHRNLRCEDGIEYGRDATQTRPALAGLVNAVTSLQKEVERLNGRAQAHSIPAVQHMQGMGTGFQAPVYYAYPPLPIPHVFSRPPEDGRPISSGEGRASLGSATGTPPSGSVPPNASQERVDAAPKSDTVQSQDTVNASTIANVHRADDAGADIFIKQMMA
ncbi:UL26 protein [Gallid alphaherpesvirus 3]|uniref:Capsid scaffolding protein n=3 Tax=Alphaherpesvirinae TaxID=10293 RepID=Q785G2_9ALPH|nr:capsid maturation protease [Gallid alphaherpesvirus 3]BAA36559.1 UL26 [Gallid alphaherpesvirus 1]BAA82921.1 UL26 product homolog [Marek's disease virus serotype 2 MDV2]BAB16535.1 UL26 protein [Gallid alphaherpesvirus 3]